MVNNAGIGFQGPVTETTLDEYDRTFNLNFRALWLLTKGVLPSMIKAREGTIINIGSIAGKMELAYSSLYCASKFAVVGFSESLLDEVRQHNIRVSVICSGLVETEFHDGRERPVCGDKNDYISLRMLLKR